MDANYPRGIICTAFAHGGNHFASRCNGIFAGAMLKLGQHFCNKIGDCINE
jgi:hypothetical protein